MLYQLRDREGRADWRRGTLIDADGPARTLGPHDWQVESEGSWTSDASGTRYPARWRVAVPSAQLALTVVPRFAAQENLGARSGFTYWEGAVGVQDAAGAPCGQGYVELVGYGGGRPLSF
jgi:predicted secreted hydrolase